MDKRFHSIYTEASRLISDSLTVNGLKVILRKLKMSSNGRKAALQAKIQDYLTSGYRRRDFNRIKYVYDMAMFEHNPPSFEGLPPNPQTTFQNLFPSAIDSQQISTIPSRSLTATDTARAPVPSQRPAPVQQPRQTVQTHTHQYTDLISKVVFKHTPFYEMKQLMTEPLEIVTHQKEARSKYTLRFTFTSEHVAAIQHQNHRVYLLSVLIDPTNQPAEYGLDFPHQMEVLANNHFIHANVRGVKGKAGSATAPDITNSLTVTQKVANLIEITVKGNSSPYAMFAYLVQPASNEDILKRIQSHPFISKQSTVQRIIDDNNDDEIQTLSTVLSLKCPLSYTKMALPVRSIHCDHIECFDALSFLLLQKQAATWTCPICNKTINFDDLAVDEYSLEIVQKTAVYDIDEIKIEPDGSWQIPQNAKLLADDKDSSSDSDSPVTRRFDRQRLEENVDIVLLSDSEDEVPPPLPPPPPLPETVNYRNNINGQANGVAIDSGAHTTTNVTSHFSNSFNSANAITSNRALGTQNINQTNGQKSASEQNRVPNTVPQELSNQQHRSVTQTGQTSIPSAIFTSSNTQNSQDRRKVSRPHEQVQYNQQLLNTQGLTSHSQLESTGPHHTNELHTYQNHVPVIGQAFTSNFSAVPKTNSYPANRQLSTHQNQTSSAPTVPPSTTTNTDARTFFSEPHQQVSAATRTEQHQSLTANSMLNAANNNVDTNTINNNSSRLSVRQTIHQPSLQTTARVPAPQAHTTKQTQVASLPVNREVGQNVRPTTTSQNASLPDSNTQAFNTRPANLLPSNTDVSVSLQHSIASSDLPDPSTEQRQSTNSTNDLNKTPQVPVDLISGTISPKFPDLENFLSLPPWETSVFFKFASRGAPKQQTKGQDGPGKSGDASLNTAATVRPNQQLLQKAGDRTKSLASGEDIVYNTKLQQLREKVINSSGLRHKESSPIDTTAALNVQNENRLRDSLTSISLRSPQLSNKSNSPVDSILGVDQLKRSTVSDDDVVINAATKRQQNDVQSSSDRNLVTATLPVISKVNHSNTAVITTENANNDEIISRVTVAAKNQPVQPADFFSATVRPVAATAATKRTETMGGAQMTAPFAAAKEAPRPISMAAAAVPVSEPTPTLGSKRTFEVIDLTLSDDEDDGQPPSKK